ncbi:MAG: DUF362 domain-containing protein [Clostridia bacterium]|jgi:uncharacterized protein (DUF362 family)/NAD-dependent dihydropyrimidine dehydrogenase PreA subunit
MTKVSVLKCGEYTDSDVTSVIAESLNSIFDLSSLLKKGMTVAVKPNLIIPADPDRCATVHPTVIRAVVEIVRSYGAKPLIVESPGGFYSVAVLKKLYETTGLAKVLNDMPEILNYDTSVKEVSFETDRGRRNVFILKPLADADLVISISKLKTHAMMIYTGAVKNMFGSIAGFEKSSYHLMKKDYDVFANELIDIFLACSPKINIMDAIYGMEGEGPTSGDPRKIGYLLASSDAFSLDSAAMDLIHMDKSISYIYKNAVSRGFDTDYEFIGEDPMKSNIYDFKLPKTSNENKHAHSKILDFILGSAKSKPFFIYDKCIGCGDCVRNCPAKVIKMINGKPYADEKNCIKCYCCAELCRSSAIEIKKPMLIKALTLRSRLNRKH